MRKVRYQPKPINENKAPPKPKRGKSGVIAPPAYFRQGYWPGGRGGSGRAQP